MKRKAKEFNLIFIFLSFSQIQFSSTFPLSTDAITKESRIKIKCNYNSVSIKRKLNELHRKSIPNYQ